MDPVYFVRTFGTDPEHVLLDTLLQCGKGNGISGLAILSGDTARVPAPHLSSKVSRALHVPNAGIISPYELAIAAAGNATDNGVVPKRNSAATATKW